LAAAQGKVARLHDANAILAEQVMEAKRDLDAAAADSSAAAVRAGQFWDRHAALIEACSDAIDVLSPTGVNIEERLGNVLRRFREVVHHTVRHGAMLALAAATL
jgi:ABC-type transporter Mla subunit MlaD